MSENATDLSRRTYFNVLLLMGIMRPATGYIDANTFPHAIARYSRELKKFGIELGAPESSVRKAIDLAVDDKILGLPDDNDYQFPIVGDVDKFIRSHNFLTEAEILSATIAARATKKAYVWGQLDKDLG